MTFQQITGMATFNHKIKRVQLKTLDPFYLWLPGRDTRNFYAVIVDILHNCLASNQFLLI
jgi:hypothetical protein